MTFFNTKELLGAVVVLGLFIAAVIGAEKFAIVASDFNMIQGVWGMVAYAVIAFVATVAAPFSAMPLMPLATELWGPLITALLSVFSWTLGSVVAFLLARLFGRPLVQRFVDLTRAEQLSHKLVGRNPFWRLVLLRMIVPVDILSYVVGLLVPMSLRRYTFATVLGVTPFAFIFAYTSVLPFWTQLFVVGSAFIVLVAVFLRGKK